MEDDRRQVRYNSMGQGASQFEDWEIQKLDDDYVGGFKQLGGRQSSTTESPSPKVKFIPNHDKLCLTGEQAQHVYESVQEGKPAQPYTSHVDIDQLATDDSEVNPYHKGLCAMVDTELFQEPRLEMDQCDLNWFILSTHFDYTTHRDLDSPYKDMNTSVLYDRLGNYDNLVRALTEISDERFEEVSCCLKTTTYYDDTNDVSTTYLGIYHAGDKPRAFNFEYHIPMEGRGIARPNPMDQTPLKLFFDSGATRSYLSHTYYKATKSLHKLPKLTTTCTGIKIGNGSIVQVLFVIPLLFMCHGHVFEIHTIVTDITMG